MQTSAPPEALYKGILMTGKERMRKTFRFEPTDRPPHFESMFELCPEAFGRATPHPRNWPAEAPAEQERLLAEWLETYQMIVKTYQWDALAVWAPWGDPRGVAASKRVFGEKIMIGSLLSGTVWSIDSIRDWDRFSEDLFEAPQELHAEAERRTLAACGQIDRLADAGADFIFLANDVAFNGGPFISPAQFAEFVTPYLARQVRRARDRGVIPIVHSDGQITPLLDQYLSLDAAALHSLDPMAGVDLAEVKRRTAGRLALMGNVQCNLLQDGPAEAITASAHYCLEHGTPGGGYIFSSSNTVFSGMPLANYEHMLAVFREWCAAHTMVAGACK